MKLLFQPFKMLFETKYDIDEYEHFLKTRIIIKNDKRNQKFYD